MFGNVPWTLQGTILLVQVDKTFFTPITVAMGDVSSYFCLFFVLLLFYVPLLGAILRYVRAHFGVNSSIFESYFPSYPMKFCTDAFVILSQAIP